MRYRALAVTMLLATAAGATEHDWPPRESPAPRVVLSVRNQTGIATAPFFTTAFPEVSGFATVLTPAAALRLETVGWLQAQLPLSYVRLDFPAGAQMAELAVGNLELAVEREWIPGVAWRGALIAPTASHGSELALLNNRALALGSALSGGRQSYLLTPGAMGVSLGASIEHFAAPLQLRASLDVPILFRTSDASLPADAETHAVGVLPVLDLRASWWPGAWFGATLGAALVAEAVRLQEPTTARHRDRRLQPLLEPSLHFRLGRAVTLGLDATIPLGGALGGSAWSVGPSARVDLR